MSTFSPICNHYDVTDKVRVSRKKTANVVAHKHMDPIAVDGCPYCGEAGSVVFTRNSIKYGREYGDWSWCYFCVCCEAYVGCHPYTIIPLGTLADQATANARKAAHKAFDPLWRDEWMTRKEAYSFLSKVIGVAREDCHISWFDVTTCEKVVAAVPAVRQLSADADKAPVKPTKPTLGDKFAKLFGRG